MFDPSVSPNAVLPTRKCRIFFLSEDYWCEYDDEARGEHDHAKSLIDGDEDVRDYQIFAMDYEAPVGFEKKVGCGVLWLGEWSPHDASVITQVFENGKWSYVE